MTRVLIDRIVTGSLWGLATEEIPPRPRANGIPHLDQRNRGTGALEQKQRSGKKGEGGSGEKN